MNYILVSKKYLLVYHSFIQRQLERDNNNES